MSVCDALGLACWPGTVGKNHDKCVLADVFTQNWHFCPQSLDTHGHITIYSMLSLCRFSSLPGVGLLLMAHLTLKAVSSFLTGTFFSSHGSVSTSSPLPSVENCNCFYTELLPLFMARRSGITAVSAFCFHVTRHYMFCTFHDYFGGCPHVCYSGSTKLPLVQITQSISLASTPL